MDFQVRGRGCLLRAAAVTDRWLATRCAGPTPDILHRTSYVAAYDRRMRHPAWVSSEMRPRPFCRMSLGFQAIVSFRNAPCCHS